MIPGLRFSDTLLPRFLQLQTSARPMLPSPPSSPSLSLPFHLPDHCILLLVVHTLSHHSPVAAAASRCPVSRGCVDGCFTGTISLRRLLHPCCPVGRGVLTAASLIAGLDTLSALLAACVDGCVPVTISLLRLLPPRRPAGRVVSTACGLAQGLQRLKSCAIVVISN